MKPALCRFCLAVMLATTCLIATVLSQPSYADEQPPTNVKVPADSPLAQIREGMSSDEVETLLGAPASSGRQVTGKAFIPFYFGTDAQRTIWRYKDIGRVIFSKGNFSASHVSSVEHDPTESGADR